MPFEPVKNPFGGVDEDATIAKAAELCGGRDKLENMDRIFKQCYPTPIASKDTVFRAKAQQDFIPLEHIEAFLVLTKVA